MFESGGGSEFDLECAQRFNKSLYHPLWLSALMAVVYLGEIQLTQRVASVIRSELAVTAPNS